MKPTVASGARQALRALVAEVVHDRAGGLGYRTVALSFTTAVEIEVEKGAGRFVIWLRPADDPGPCYRATARFKVGYSGSPPDRTAYALIDALCAGLAGVEGELAEATGRELFEAEAPEWLSGANLELMAVAAGLKPACRHIVAPPEVAGLIDQVRRQGLHAHPVQAAEFVAGFHAGVVRGEDTIVYLGRSAAAAATAAAAERAMIEAGRGDAGADHPPMAELERAFGATLGYPPCCVDAYIALNDRPNAELRFLALQRTAGPASYLLNNVDHRYWLISHFACRYDCGPSQRYAEAVGRELARVDAGAAAALARELCGLVVMFRSGGALRLATRPAAASGRHGIEAVRVSGEGPHLVRWRAALRDGDELELGNGTVRIWRHATAVSDLATPADEVLVRPFD